jgi:hypothetical protein
MPGRLRCVYGSGVTDDRRQPQRGQRLHGTGGRRIGKVDAVFADYLLVRTGGLLPVDLYVPRSEISTEDGRLSVSRTPAEAYEAWHRPLRRVAHD